MAGVLRVWADGESNDGAEPTDPVAVNRRIRQRLGDRPWVSVSMVSSLDGSVIVSGRAGPLSNTTDQQVFQAARAECDVVLVGAETVRAEGYGAGPPGGPRVGVITRRAELDYTTALFTSGTGFVVTTAAATAPPAGVDVCRVDSPDGSVRMRDALRAVDQLLGPVTTLHLDGGPAVLSQALHDDVVDELNITFSPHVTLGDGPRLASGFDEQLRRFDLEQLAVEDSYLFSRWIRRR